MSLNKRNMVCSFPQEEKWEEKTPRMEKNMWIFTTGRALHEAETKPMDTFQSPVTGMFLRLPVE